MTDIFNENMSLVNAISSSWNEVPIENIWLLFVYAYDLLEVNHRDDLNIETSPDLKSLIAKMLCHAIEKRIQRNLSFGYQRREEVLRRVRGRIDIFRSISGDLFRKGQVACRFEELTIDTLRNRFVRSALSALADYGLDPKSKLALRCRNLAYVLEQIGVKGKSPSYAEVVSDQIARHEIEDRLIVSLAHAVFNLVLPMEKPGARSFFRAQIKDRYTFADLFEKAIRKILFYELHGKEGWEVTGHERLSWPVTAGSRRIGLKEGLTQTRNSFGSFLQGMETDITLLNKDQNRKIIIDAKSANVLKPNRYSELKFNNKDLFQIFSYLRSQEREDDFFSFSTEGILLHPSYKMDVDETVLIQGHRIRFVTIDLNLPSNKVIEQLCDIPRFSRLNLIQSKKT